MKKFLLFLLIVLAIGAIVVWLAYGKVFKSATAFEEDSKVIYVPTACEFPQLLDTLLRNAIIADSTLFVVLAERKQYHNNIKPGKYRIKKGSSLNELVNQLRSGNQEPVRLTFSQVRTPEELAGDIAKYIEADSIGLLQILKSSETAEKFGFNVENFRTMFLPDSYEFYWDTDPVEFVDRMAKEYKNFWNDDRKEQAARLNMSQSEITILASIVKAECAQKDEAPVIAGVYLNRIRIKMPLQADPTLVFARGDFSIRRVLASDKLVDSPYNTYMYAGLPPGPINYPEYFYIDAVLNADKNDFIYFCAKADFSGYHAFARNYEQHLENARAYQRALDQRGINR
jgi:UPF0755 protein